MFRNGVYTFVIGSTLFIIGGILFIIGSILFVIGSTLFVIVSTLFVQDNSVYTFWVYVIVSTLFVIGATLFVIGVSTLFVIYRARNFRKRCPHNYSIGQSLEVFCARLSVTTCSNHDNTLRRVAGDLRSYEDGRLPHDAADALILNLELVCREIPAQEQVDEWWGRNHSG